MREVVGGGMGRGRTNEGITSIDIMYVIMPMLILISCMRKGVGSEPGESPSAVCMYVTIIMNYIMM